MSELTFCPTCGIPWPNFCPIDGTRLSGPWTCKNAPKPVIRTPVTAAVLDAMGAQPEAAQPEAAQPEAPQPEAPLPKRPRPEPLLAPSHVPEPEPAPLARAPLPKAPQAPAPATTSAEDERPRRRADPNLVETLIGQAGARPASPQTRGGGRRGPRDMPTTILPVPPEPARPAPKAAEPAPAAPARARKRAKGEFSDTQWFMKGKNLQVADPDTGAVVVDEEAYLVDESIPEEERRKFSLRKPEEE